MAEPDPDVQVLSPRQPQRQELESVLGSTDYIMEPKCMQTISKYVDLGGNPKNVVDLLADNYKAQAQTVNLMASWLTTAGVDAVQVQEQVENHLQELIIKHFDPKAANEILTEGDQGIPSWLNDMLTYKKWRQTFYKLIEEYPDCLLLNFVIRLISNAGYQSEIKDVHTACTQPDVFERVFRTLLLEFIAEDDYDSVLKISNVSEEGLPLNTKDRHRSGNNRERERSGEREEDFHPNQINESATLTELCQLCCHSEHTYLLAVSVLETISQHYKNLISEKYFKIINGKYTQAETNDSISYITFCFEMKILQISRKIKQELEKFSHRRGKTSTVEAISSLQNRIVYRGFDNVRDVITAIFMTINRGNISSYEINTLYDLYYVSEDPPPVVLLQNPLFLETLVCWLFTPTAEARNDEAEDDLRNKSVELLGYSCSVTERLYIENDTAEQLQMPREECRNTNFILTQTLEIIMPNNTHNMAFDTNLLILSGIDHLIANIGTPVVARGLLHWIEYVVINSSKVSKSSSTEEEYTDHYWNRVRTLNPINFITGAASNKKQYTSTSTGAYHMALIDEIVVQQPTLHPKVSSLLIKMFEQQLPLDFEVKLQLDVRKCVLDRMVHLIARGFYTLPLLIFIQKRTKSLDISLLRYFIVKILNVVSSPYSKRFQNILLNLIQTAEIDSDASDIPIVKKFVYYTQTGIDLAEGEVPDKNLHLAPHQSDQPIVSQIAEPVQTKKKRRKRRILPNHFRTTRSQTQMQLQSEIDSRIDHNRAEPIMTRNRHNTRSGEQNLEQSSSSNFNLPTASNSVSTRSQKTRRQNSVKKSYKEEKVSSEEEEYSESNSTESDSEDAFLM